MTYAEASSRLKHVCREDDNYKLRDAMINEVNRLRGVIKSVEYNNLNIADSSCPWCSVFQGRSHTGDCPAFTPDGVVR